MQRRLLVRTGYLTTQGGECSLRSCVAIPCRVGCQLRVMMGRRMYAIHQVQRRDNCQHYEEAIH